MAFGKGAPKISHARFAVVFPLLLFAVCNALNLDRLTRWFHVRDGFDLSAFAAYLVAGSCLFVAFFVLLAHRWTVKPAAILLVASSAAATYFIAKYDVAIDSSMILNSVHTDPVEVGQLLSAGMIPYAVFLIVLPLAMIVPVEITFARGATYLVSSAKLFSVAVLAAVVALYSDFNAIHRAGNVSNKYIVYSLVPVNVISGTLSAAGKLAKPYLRRRKAVEIAGRVTEPGDLLVVLVVGESSRRASFSLYGYERQETNPVLRTVDGLHLLNGRARRGSTLDALPEILERDGITLPQIVSRLGVPTACYVNYTLYENCVEPGETKVSDCGHGGKCYDEDVVPLFERDLATYRSGYRFVVLHLGGGSHGPTYVDRHPPEFVRFEPTCREADVANDCSLEELYNAYDNTILYADFVLGEVVSRLEASGAPYVLIYLSDHGESLLEEGRMFHGMPPGVALPPEQAEVPLIVKSSVPIRIDRRPEYRQQEVFDTVLDLFAIETTSIETAAGFIERVDETVGPESAPDRAGGRSTSKTDGATRVELRQD